MRDSSQMTTRQWTSKQAIVLAAVCLGAGTAGGWAIRASQGPPTTAAVPAVKVLAPMEKTPSAAPGVPDTARLKEMADAQAQPLLDRLKSNAGDADLLTRVGNLYYDAKQYPIAVDYYGRALRTRPSDAAVRTDMATAYWYMGNADAAIAEFNKALSYAPTSPNTLFNLGLVKWQGKTDAAGAIADWEKLLKANPNYEGKEKVEQMLADVKKRAADDVAMKMT